MKQRLTGKILSMLFLLFAIGWTVNSSAQGVTFSTQDNGDGNKTLIVSAYGNLDGYTAKVATQKKWTKVAENNVYSGSVGNEQTVSENQVVDETSATQYYTAEKTYTLLFDGGMPTTDGNYASNINTTYKWNPSKWAPKHIYKVEYYNWNNTWNITAEVNADAKPMQSWESKVSYNGVEYAPYIISDDEITTTTFDPSTVTFLKVEDLNNYYNSTTTYQANNGLYRSQNDGTPEALTSGTTYTYEPTDKFYSATNVYTKIDNIGEFLSSHTNYYIQETGDRDFTEIVALNLVSNGCTSIKFEQDAEHADDPIKINISQFASIMDSHPNGTYNYPLATNNASIVDFSAVNVPANDFSSFSFSGTNGPSIILPNNLTDAEAMQISSTIGYTYGNIYWLSEKNQDGKYTALNVQIKNDAKFVSAATAKKDEESVKSVVLYGSLTRDTPLSYFDIAGIDNLVLSNITQKGSLDVFKKFTNVKRVILKDEQNLAQYDAIINDNADNPNHSIVVVQTITNMGNGESDIDDSQTYKNEEGKSVNYTLLKSRILKPGGMTGLAHYYQEDYSKAYWMEISGTADATDFAFFNDLDIDKLNLNPLKFSDDVTDKESVINSIKNDKVKYLALPDIGADPTDPLFETLRKNNTNLKAVCQYNSVNNKFTSYSEEEGSLPYLTSMINNSTNNIKVNIRKGKLSGKLNARDLCNGSINVDENGHFVFTEPVNEYSTDQVAGRTLAGEPKIGAFSHDMDLIDLKNAEFSHIEDFTLSKTNLPANETGLQIVIPSSVTELPADFMNSTLTMESICIPHTILKIGPRAFHNMTRINHITTTDKDGNLIDYGFSNAVKVNAVEEDGKTYSDQFEVPDTPDPNSGSFVFSDALQEIGTLAFDGVYRIKDIYCLSEKAPMCSVDAFGSNACTGNNGYSPRGGITRNDYYKGVSSDGYGEHWVVMLHYPTSIQGTDLEKLYTDVTRDYTISDAEGHTDGQGNLLCWPNQSEFNRSYTQGTNGYLWRAWNTKRSAWNNSGSYPLDHAEKNTDYNISQDKANTWYTECDNSDKQDAIFYHTGYETNGTSVVRINDDTKDVDQGAWKNVKNSDPDKVDELLYDGDYRGWHQFVLCATSRAKGEDPGHNFRFINDNGWWTICVPFDMTKSEVRQMFGIGGKHGGPHVCEFTGVERVNPEGESKGSILLKFDRDVYNNVYKKDADNKSTLEIDHKTGDDEIVIHAGVPYMLQPDFDVKDDGSLRTPFAPSDQIFRSEKCKARTNLELRTFARDNFVDVLALDKQGNSVKDANNNDYHYYFIGNFWQTEMPQYAYFLAWYYPTPEQIKEGFSPNGFATYFWQKEMPAQTLNWNAFTAIIGSQWPSEERRFFVPEEVLGNIHWYTRKGNAATGGSVFYDDSFPTSSPAKRGNSPENVSFSFGGDNTADGITKVHFGDQTLDVYNGKVYNLNGQYVGDSLENLPKGIYIAGGKKYVVK